MPRDMDAGTIDRLREAVRTRADHTSLRKVARQIGMSPSGLKKFLGGAAPYSPTLRRLQGWYVQHAGVQHGHVEFPEADAALNVLVHDLTPDARRRTVNRVVECLRLGYGESGKVPPRWLSELRVAGGDNPHTESTEEEDSIDSDQSV